MTAVIALILFILAHFASCYLWYRFSKASKQEKLEFMPLLACLPVIGLVCAWLSSKKAGEERETPVSKLYKHVEKDIMTVNAGRPELDAVVPFDEVLLLSNDKTRREVMMHILRHDPFAYLEMLKTAKVSTDVEITHYATTTIMEIQRDLDISMQKAEKEFNENIDNLDAVNRFINVLSAYINTGLLLENRMLQLRRQLSQILEHKISIFPNSRSAHLLLIENEINLGNYGRAAEVAAMMREKWPTNESSWLTSLHVCMAAGDSAEKENITKKMADVEIIWSKAGRNESEFLCGRTN